MNQLVFLPGASGSQGFWQPLVACLKPDLSYKVMAYPGFDGVASHPSILSLHDLQEWVSEQVEDDSIVIAQSMGGVLAIGAALEHSDKVKGLVLLATSGGLNLTEFDCIDWRTDYRQQFKAAPDWFVDDQTEFSRVQLSRLEVPILLIWGERDPLSSVQVGQYLEQSFKNAQLHVIPAGDHFFAATHPTQVADLIHAYLERI